MEETNYRWYVLFPNHQHGLRLSEELKGRGLKYSIAPTPRRVSTSCGISLVVEEADLLMIRAIIEENRISIENIVKVPIQTNWQYRSS